MDALAEWSDCTRRLRTVALGALSYSDLYSTSAFEPGDVQDYLRLRFYRVDYHDVYPVGPSAVLTLLGEGTKDSVEGICEPLDIFDIYWLG